MHSERKQRGNYVIAWEFRVRPEMESRFEQTYGPQGPWVRFFAQNSEYIATELIRDANDHGRYLTIDRWKSQAAYEQFREQHREEYSIIDAQCERMTHHEAEIGRFEVV